MDSLSDDELTAVFGALSAVMFDLSIPNIRKMTGAMGLDAGAIPAQSEAKSGMGSRAEVVPAVQQLFREATNGRKQKAVQILAARLSDRDQSGTTIADRCEEALREHGYAFDGENIVQLDQVSQQDFDDLLPLFRKGIFPTRLQELAAAADSKHPLSLIFVDLDHFKKVNDKHGHDIGDEVLCGAADVLNDCVGNKGASYRFGGEELVILVSNYTSDEASVLAERIRVQLDQSSLSSKGLRVTASIGVATIPEHAHDAEGLLKAADGAMYEAKKFGRNCVRLSGEPPPSPNRAKEIARRKPDANEFAEEDMEKIRLEYYSNGSARCPHDNAALNVKENQTLGQRTPDLSATCNICGRSG